VGLVFGLEIPFFANLVNNSFLNCFVVACVPGVVPVIDHRLLVTLVLAGILSERKRTPKAAPDSHYEAKLVQWE
jgi:hypothetical protein